MRADDVMTPTRGRCRTRAAFCGAVVSGCAAAVIASGAGAASPGPSVVAALLPPAETWSDSGVAPAVAGESRGKVRVRLILASQELLAAANSDQISAQLQPQPEPLTRRQAIAHPGRITPAEKRSAERAESSYEQAVEQLQPAADATGEDLDQVAAQVGRRGGEVLDSEIAPAAVIARVPAPRLPELAKLAGVEAIEAAPKPKPLSEIGTQAVGAPVWWAAGYTGGTGTSDSVPADAGVNSEIPDATHPAFSGVNVDNYSGYTPDDHGTHTAGIVASQDATYRGVAYGIDRLVNGAQGYQLGFAVNGNPAPPDPVEVMSNSFGSFAANDDANDGDDVLTDFFGVSQAFGAGNSNTSGAPTVDNIGRNTMSVGAFNDVGTVGSSDDVVLGISARGPTPGGRKKPDLTAPGGSVVAPSIFWNNPPSNPDFTGATGTSFSGPHVAGAMTLLEGSGITDPMAQRALLINSARDWNGTNDGLRGWTAGTQTGWRPEVGWGELDLTTALAQRANYRLGSVKEGEAAFYRATVPAGSKATMAFQLRGYFVGYPNPGTQTIKYTQSDLDLRQYRSDDTEVSPPAAFDPPDTAIDPGPDAVDPNDTVEQVRSPATPASQQITYKVQSASTIDGASAEPFAIAAAAPLTPLVAPTVRPSSLAASPTGAVSCSTPVTVSTTLANDSPDIAAANAAVGIELPAGVQLVSGAATQVVSGGILATSATSESHSWTIQAITDGPKTITVAGVGEGYGTPFRRADTITLDADCVAPETSIDSGPAGPTKDATPTFAFSASGGASGFDCSLDGVPFAPCSSPYAAPALGDGPHSFAVRGRDPAGNLDASPAVRAFIVDTVAPDTSITSGPSGAIRSSSATFAVAGGSAYECSSDGGTFSTCSPSTTVGDLGEGRHTFAARAIDAAGNVDPTPASRAFSVDRSVTGAKLRVKKNARFKGKLSLKVKANLAEPGTVRIRAQGKAGRKRVKSMPARAKLSGSRPAKLRLGASARANRTMRKGLNGGVLTMTITAHFKDVLGNRVTIKRTVTFR